jgi:predicted enzyme related to lactoylglutathione lyase
MSHAINWFEIFVADLDRATRFYETALGVQLRRETFAGTQMSVFASGPDGVGGALVQDPTRKPSAEGPLVYLNAGGKLDAVLGRVAAAKGAVVLPKTDIGEPGFIAIVQDSEGNRVGLHSPR